MDRAIQSTKNEAPKYQQDNTRDNQHAGNTWARLDASDKKVWLARGIFIETLVNPLFNSQHVQCANGMSVKRSRMSAINRAMTDAAAARSEWSPDYVNRIVVKGLMIWSALDRIENGHESANVVDANGNANAVNNVYMDVAGADHQVSSSLALNRLIYGNN